MTRQSPHCRELMVTLVQLCLSALVTLPVCWYPKPISKIEVYTPTRCLWHASPRTVANWWSHSSHWCSSAWSALVTLPVRWYSGSFSWVRMWWCKFAICANPRSQPSTLHLYGFSPAIRHIAITNCPFRFAFSHLPRCVQLLRQKHRNNFTWHLCARFFHISDSNKPSQSVQLIYELA